MVVWLCVRVPKIDVNPCLAICITKLSLAKNIYLVLLITELSICHIFVKYPVLLFLFTSECNLIIYIILTFFFFKACTVSNSVSLLFPPHSIKICLYLVSS